jgi:Protein of unknown function (DUF664)
VDKLMTPTGTNLLGLVKHCAASEFVYFGRLQGRPLPDEGDLDWHEGDETELSGHMYATEAESREQVTDFYRRVHMIQETARHAGHADIIRESIDGVTGERDSVGDLPAENAAAAWKLHYDKVESIAQGSRKDA